jgi:queuine tRNA-ribosyltransferase
LLAKEFLAHRLLSIHNLHVYLQLMRDIRAAITEGTFGALHRSFADDGQG